MYCVKCGNKINEGDSFCKNCGWKKDTEVNNNSIKNNKDILTHLQDGERVICEGRFALYFMYIVEAFIVAFYSLFIYFIKKKFSNPTQTRFGDNGWITYNPYSWLISFLNIMNICVIVYIFLIAIISTLRVGNAKLTLTNKRLVGSRGILNVNEIEYPLDKINSVQLLQPLFGRIFGFGTIVVTTSSSTYQFGYMKNAK